MSRAGQWSALVAVPLLALGGCLGVVVLVAGPLQAASCQPAGAGVVVDTATLPKGAVAGYSGEQLSNAAKIINAGQSLGLSVKGQTIGVMTAMGESSLRVLEHGDSAGPDSRGLFQQRGNGAWGSLADRMDPTTSATNFFKALLGVDGWESMSPTLAAHAVQRNADPYHYVAYWDAAVEVVTALAGTEVTGVAAGTGDLACTASSPSSISAEGWLKPAVGPVTSEYSPRRWHPVLLVWKQHTGTDIGAGCDAPIRAAADGVVVQAGASSGYGHLIAIDHGGGVVTRYAHMYASGVLTHVGAEVKAGDEIGRVGSDGLSTGCHLHFEVMEGGVFEDPVPFMADRNAPLE